MSNHIGSFLHLYHCIAESSQKLDKVYVVHVILLSLPCFGTWDVVKQDLLDKNSNLTLYIVTTELLMDYDC